MTSPRMLRRILYSTALILLAAGVVAAGMDAKLDASFGAGDDHELYIAISSRYFDARSDVVADYGVRYGDPDDLAVALHIERRCEWTAEIIYRKRSGGMGWAEIAQRCAIQPESWFVGQHSTRDPKEPLLLNDFQIRDLMAVRMIHEYYGIAPDAAVELRASGRNLRALMSGEYHRRHGNAARHTSRSQHAKADSTRDFK